MAAISRVCEGMEGTLAKRKSSEDTDAQKLQRRLDALEGRLDPLSSELAKVTELAKAQIGEIAKQVERETLDRLVDERLAQLQHKLETEVEARELRHKKRLDEMVDTLDEESDRYLALVQGLPAGGVEALRQDRDALQAELEEAQKALIATRQEVAEREAEVHDLRTRDNRVRLDEALAAQRELEKTRVGHATLEQLETEIARLEAELERFRSAERQEAAVFRQEAELEAALTKVDELVAENDRLRRTLHAAQQEQSRLRQKGVS